MPIAPLLLVSVCLHAWIAWRIGAALPPGLPGLAVLFWVPVLVSCVLMPLGFMARRLPRGRLVLALTWAGLLCMGLFSTLLVLTIVRDALLVVAWSLVVAVSLAGVDWSPLTSVQQWSAAAVPVLAIVATAWGFWNARRTATVVRVDVPITGLPAQLHGFTVAQISDVHVGPTIRHAYVRRIVARVNLLGADMVAITGDLVDGRVADLRHHVAPLSGLVSRHGTFFVTGNHEYYSGAHAWIAELRSMGIDVLLNEHRVLQHDSGHRPDGMTASRATGTLVVAGVADFNAHQFDQSHRSDPALAMAGAPVHAGMRMLLAHQPRSAAAASLAGFQLQLSGHTHGGQFWPWMYFVQYQQPFTAGLGRLHELWVYTSRGTGYWGPPKRFGVSAEITHLRLVTA